MAHHGRGGHGHGHGGPVDPAELPRTLEHPHRHRGFSPYDHSRPHRAKFNWPWLVGLTAAVAVVATGCEAYAQSGYDLFTHPHTSTWDPSGIDSASPRTGQINPNSPRVNLGLANSTDPGLKKLAQVERQYSYAPSANLMRAEMPASVADAEASAQAMAKKLKEYGNQGVEPFVFFGSAQDIHSKKMPKLEGGAYQGVIDAYFRELKNAGVTDKEMGCWIPLPDANDTTQKGGAVSPKDFQDRAVLAAQNIKTHWNTAKVGFAFKASDPMQSYVEGVPSDLIDVLGVEAFPTAPGQSATSYLPLVGPASAAHTLGAKEMWVRTGTYNEAHGPHGQEVTVTPHERSQQLATGLGQVAVAKDQGFVVNIDVRMDNDYANGGANWSYGPADYTNVIAGLGTASQYGVSVMFEAG